MQIKKIKDKDNIEVVSQLNCSVVGKPTYYEGMHDDCLNDCTAFGYPSYYASPKH